MRIGVISDTHGLLRPEALAALQGVDHILHSGDVGDIAIVERLRAMAPVTVIRGNVDTHGACAELPATEMIELGGKNFYLVHSVHDLDIVPEAAEIACVVSGHSHQPEIRYSEKLERRGVLYLNPGSAGPRRFSLPVSLAMVTIDEETMRAEIIELL
ncbi:MAG TPA: metallophosphoesterase family protein [Acidobacteriaceae bacterium]|jgi:putative phosphoesterase|nr:metallophosphoesterase family protein [Acidobacteriaceae bacterium]